MVVELRFLTMALNGILISCSTEQGAPDAHERASIVQIFRSNDINSDKCLSSSEWRKMAEASTDFVKNEASNPDQFKDWTLELFTEIDLDRNKCVTLEEYIKFSKSSQAQGE